MTIHTPEIHPELIARTPNAGHPSDDRLFLQDAKRALECPDSVRAEIAALKVYSAAAYEHYTTHGGPVLSNMVAGHGSFITGFPPSQKTWIRAENRIAYLAVLLDSHSWDGRTVTACGFRATL